VPRHFGERERKIIEDSLVHIGRELFAARGLARVTIEELCRAAKIAKGSFYSFFPSKEAFFLSIVKIDETRMRRDVSALMKDSRVQPGEQFRRIYGAQLLALERYPMLRIAAEPETYALLVRRLPPDSFDDAPDAEFMGALVKGWKERGFACRYTARQLLDLSRALFFIHLHRKDGLVGDSLRILIGLLGDSMVKGGPAHG
jgi:AcrR family transcriptional regulator